MHVKGTEYLLSLKEQIIVTTKFNSVSISKKLTTERRYNYFIKDNTTVHTEMTSSEWYSASS